MNTCPRCKSRNIDIKAIPNIEFTETGLIRFLDGTTPMGTCYDCHFKWDQSTITELDEEKNMAEKNSEYHLG